MSYEIRIAVKEDTATILEIYKPYILKSTTSFEIDVPSLNSFQNRIDKVQAKAPWLVCCTNNKVIGFAYAGDHRGRQAYNYNRELSVYVSKQFQGKKIGKALYLCLIDILKLQGYTNILAGITQPNKPSVKFHKSIGFTYIGTYHNVGYKFGAYRDVSWWEMMISESPPGKIIHYSDLPPDDLKQCFQKAEKHIQI